MLDEGSTSVDQALEQVRDLSLLLRPSLLDHLGLEGGAALAGGQPGAACRLPCEPLGRKAAAASIG